MTWPIWPVWPVSARQGGGAADGGRGRQEACAGDGARHAGKPPCTKTGQTVQTHIRGAGPGAARTKRGRTRRLSSLRVPRREPPPTVGQWVKKSCFVLFCTGERQAACPRAGRIQAQ